MIRTVLLFACTMLVCTSCGGQKNKKSAGTEAEALKTEGILTADSVNIYDPGVPLTITDPDERGRWAAAHWWDKFEFADTTTVVRWGDYAEQAFVNFNYHFLRFVPLEIGSQAVTTLFGKATVNKAAFMKFAEVAEKYLFDPIYDYRSEDLYIAVLNAVLANPALDEWERIRPQEQLRLALKNRVGEPAADFRYTLANGASGTLHTLKARYTLLFFNTPGCSGCRDMMGYIKASPYLSNLIETGTLAVLAVYAGDDLAAWREYLPNMPEGWIASYDAARKIENEELYDLKASPTIYLLDRDKRVMLKDVMSIPLIEQTIYNNEQPQQ